MAVVILAVDDDADFLRALRTAIENERFSVHTVQTGQKALAFLERRGPFASAPMPDFIVLDYRLEDMNAPQVLEAMTRWPALARIPVLVISQARWQEDEKAALAAGARAFCAKPSRLRALRDVVVSFWEEQSDEHDGSAHRG